MSPAKMIAHLRRTLALSMGEHPAEDRSIPLLRRGMFWLATRGLPWPRGHLPAPADWTPEPAGDLQTELDHLVADMQRFARQADRTPRRRSVHTLFGPLTLDDWARLHGRHIEYHLRQFGA